VHFTSSDSQAVIGTELPSDYTFTAGDAGARTVSATLKTAGTQSITATDTVTSSITGAQSGITVDPAATSTLVVNGFTSPTTAGVAHSVSVTAEDAYGNITPAYTGTVQFTSSDGQAVLPANYTFTAGDAGAHTFSATLKTAGTQSISATDTTTSSITGIQTGIQVDPAATSTLVVSGFTSPTTAGDAHDFTVRAEDAFGNTTPAYAGTVHFTSSDGQASLPTEYSFNGSGVSNDNGLHTFSATLKTAGSQSITVTDTATASITGTQSGIVVNPAATSTLVVGDFTNPTTAGDAHNVTVRAEDAYGNTTPAYSGTVHFTSSDGQAVLPSDSTFVGADAGVQSLSAILKTAGTQSITATDTTTSSITGTQSPITVNPAAASILTLSGYPSPTTAGVAHTFTVTAYDPYSNVATGYTGTVQFTSSDPQAAVGTELPSDYTFTAGNAGKHTFSVTLKTAGTRSITATDTTTASITGVQGGIVVNPAATSTLVVSGFASPTTAGMAHSVSVTAKDAFGNATPAYIGTVHFSSSDGQAVLPANYTFSASDAGTHSFTNGVTLKTAGTQSITGTDTITASITGAQSGITVNPAATSTLMVSGFMSPTIAGMAHSVSVTAKDPFTNITPAYTGTLQFTSSDGQGVVPADYTFTAGDAGTHSFSTGVTLEDGRNPVDHGDAHHHGAHHRDPDRNHGQPGGDQHPFGERLHEPDHRGCGPLRERHREGRLHEHHPGIHRSGAVHQQ